MAITIVEVGGEPNSSEQYTFMIESSADVSSLPTDISPMSSALTNTGELYVLGTDHIWRKW